MRRASTRADGRARRQTVAVASQALALVQPKRLKGGIQRMAKKAKGGKKKAGAKKR